jgi:putative hydrolase of the HAD superfamily
VVSSGILTPDIMQVVPDTRPTHLLFDFFGTLVHYSESRTEQGYHGSHAMLRRLGADLTYAEFLAEWAALCADFDRRSDVDDHEFSMVDVGTEFLAAALGTAPARADVEAFVEEYVREWNTGVRYPDGVADLIRGLATRYRLAVVTNTYHPPLVPDHLAAMGIRDCFDAVITSVEVGWRKPHPTIYATALSALGVTAGAAAFVGDTYAADFAGPRRAGMTAFLIDPHDIHRVPVEHRLGSVFDLPYAVRSDHRVQRQR